MKKKYKDFTPECPSVEQLQRFADGQMGEEEVLLLEKRLDNCKDCLCADILEGLQIEKLAIQENQKDSSLIKGLDHDKLNPIIESMLKNAKKEKNDYFFWLIAATAILLIGLALYLSNTKSSIPPAKQIVKNPTLKDDSSTDRETNSNETIEKKQIIDEKKEMPISENKQLAFLENGKLEQQINNRIRSSKVIEIISPINGAEFSGTVDFRWMIENQGESINFEILDNKENIVRKESIAATKNEIQINVKDFRNGLYYWRLMGKREVYHVGKFKIIP
jgi:hypothetical protein